MSKLDISKGRGYFRDKNLLYGNVVHYPYKKTLGANYYVTKHIGSDKIEYDIIKTPLKSEGLEFTEVSVYDYLYHLRF